MRGEGRGERGEGRGAIYEVGFTIYEVRFTIDLRGTIYECSDSVQLIEPVFKFLYAFNQLLKRK